MKKIYVYFISLLLFPVQYNLQGQGKEKVQLQEKAGNVSPDSVIIPLKIRAAIDIVGPVIYFTDKSTRTYEGYISADLNEKMALFAGGGYSNFKYSSFNYSYLSKGIYFKAGVDFNMLKPEIHLGKYWAGIGLRYGISSFTTETPSFRADNYWGTNTKSIPAALRWGHYLEASPGFRAELFNNFSIGWSINVRKLVYTGGGKDLRPVYIPGYGNGTKPVSLGINYFIVINIPVKKIKVAIKKEAPEEPVEEVNPANTGTEVR